MKSRTKHDLTLLDAHEYLADLTREVRKAKKRIMLMSLVVTDDSATHELIEELIAATKRGVEVNIAADAFTYSELGGFFSPFKHTKIKSRATTAMAQRFREAGAAFTWLGTGLKFNPFQGVTHIKWTIVDDTTFIFGGINMYENGLKCVDYMFRSLDPHLADEITTQHLAVIKNDPKPRAYADYISKSPYGTIYIDSGKRRDSIIYNRICELAGQAEHIVVVSQYCPSSRFASYLRADNSSIYFNHPNNTNFLNGLFLLTTRLRSGLQSLYTRKKYLHAKFIIFTMPGGKKIAITGSHNFSHTGVLFGTREVALETTEPHIIKQLEDFFKKEIK